MVIAKRVPIAPLYSTLGDLQTVLDATGLRWNTNNAYGIVDSLGSVTTWKGITPGVTAGMSFVAGSVGDFAPLHLVDGFVNFAGGARVIHENTTFFNFLHYNAVAANLKSTIHIVCKIGNETNPNWVYGILGNNGTSSGNRGIHARYEGRASIPRTNGLSQSTTSGVATNISGNEDNVITPNTPFVLTLETDNSQAAADKYRWYINDVEFVFASTQPAASLVSGYAIPLEIGGCGNGVLPLFGWVSHVIIQSRIETAGVRTAFIQSLLPYTIKKSNQYFQVDESRTYNANTFLDESIYYLNVAVEKNPVTGNILCVYGQWTAVGHSWADGNIVAFRKSTGDVSVFAAKATAFDPGANRGIIDCGFFFDSTGKGHGFANTMDGTGSTSTPGTSKIFYFSTTDDGDNWSSSEVTPPSDGLEFTACYGNGYEANGFNWFCVYRLTEDTTSSARYILKWAVGADISTIQWILVESGATYINEGSIAYLGGNSHVMVCRNESTNEWTQYYTDDNWATNTNQGALDWGEASTAPGPVRIVKFQMSKPDGSNPTDVLKCYYPLRGDAILKAVYATCANIITSGLTGWDLDTKTLIVDDTEFVHYGGAYHIDNGFNFFAVYSRESATALNTLISFRGPSTEHGLVKTQLGI